MEIPTRLRRPGGMELYRVKVFPVVFGVLSTILNLKQHLSESKILGEAVVKTFVGCEQREALCSTVGIVGCSSSESCYNIGKQVIRKKMAM